MVKTEYSIKELDRIVKYAHALDALGATHGIRLDSLDDIVVYVGGEETAFTVKADNEGDIFVSLVVPL